MMVRLTGAAIILVIISAALFCLIGPDANTTTYEDPIEPEDIPGYSTTILTSGTGTGTVRITGVSEDLDVTYIANANTGSSFLGWYEDNALLSGSATIIIPATSGGVVTATFGTSDQILKSFTWDYVEHSALGDVTITDNFGLVMSSSAYDASIGTATTPRLATASVTSPVSLVDPDDVKVMEVAAHIRSLDTDATDLQLADMALRFVQQAIIYTSDAELFKAEEFWEMPYESLFNKAGDCEDSAILFSSICEAMGIQSAIVMFPTHCGTAIVITGVTGGTEFSVDGVNFTYCETASDSYIPIGVLSSTYNPVDATVVPVPRG